MNIMQVAAVIIIFIVSVFYHGFMLLTLWAWFIIPFGMPPLTLPWAIGLSVLIGSIKGWPETDGRDESIWFTLLKTYAAVTLYLVVGWFVHGFM
ncbi:hypothetical protein [Erwinia mallotivora]|uniref:hypothetical protein n=1 Tax=Erwinia mallotivora TaxID=69222 RepID=UPI0021BE0131|nr:hypothetical protein [Erwinia mallotivora]